MFKIVLASYIYTFALLLGQSLTPRPIQTFSSNSQTPRDLSGSDVTVFDIIDKMDGTIDIVLNLNSQSPDVSYIDAVRYSFPDGIQINSGLDENNSMPESTSSAVCDITIQPETNSIIFGDLNFLDDPNTGSGWGCFSTDNHIHTINVNSYEEEFTLDYYLADDCYQSCVDIENSVLVPTFQILDLPEIESLTLVPGQNQVTLNWQAPQNSLVNEDISYHDNSLNNNIYMSAGDAIAGTFFSMPLGSNQSFIGAVEILGVDGFNGTTTLYGFNVSNGIPNTEPAYEFDITLTDGWNQISLGWQFNGDFLIGIKITTSIAIGLDSESTTTNQSWININSWESWNNLANNYGLDLGEWMINAIDVNTINDGYTLNYNLYKAVDDSEFTLISQNQTESYFIDNDVEVDGSVYCYTVTSTDGIYESDYSDFVCYDSGQENEIITSTISFLADLSDINVFDSGAHSIEVRGSWDEWNSGHTMDLDGDYYKLDLDITGAPGQVMEWRFKANPDHIWSNNGWEVGAPRIFTFDYELNTFGPFTPNIVSVEESLIPEFIFEDNWVFIGDTASLEFLISPLSPSFSMVSFEARFSSDLPQEIEYIGLDITGSTPEQSQWILSDNIQDDYILIAGAGSQPISNMGTLFKLKFKIDEYFTLSEEASYQIILQDFLVNESNVYDPEQNISASILIPACNSNYAMIFCDGGAYQEEVSWELFNSNNDLILNGGAPFYLNSCLQDDLYRLEMYDSYGDGWNGVMFAIYDLIQDSMLVTTTLDTGSNSSAQFLIGDYDQLGGCMDQSAINFDSEAIFDDGSCLYQGDVCSSPLFAIEGEDGNTSDGDNEWFIYNATTDGVINITTCYNGQTEDTDVTVFSGCPSEGGYELISSDDAYCGLITGGNDYASDLTLAVSEGETYYIHWKDTWNPGQFTWYLYESAQQNSPSNFTAIPGPASVFLNWDVIPLSFNQDIRIANHQSVNDNYLQSLTKKNSNNVSRIQNSLNQNTRSSNHFQSIKSTWLERTGRNTAITITLYDSYGDGYEGDGYLEDENGVLIAIFPGSDWGSEITYGPYDLADGIYQIYFDEAQWMGETSWDVKNADGEIISNGSVSSITYFGIGEVEVPQAEIVIDSLWYDNISDVVKASLSNSGSASTGSFYATFYLDGLVDIDCGNEDYQTYFLIDSIPASGSVIVSTPQGVQEYFGGYGNFQVGVSVDHFCTVSEENESNNILFASIEIIDPFDSVEWNVYRQEAAQFSAISVTDSNFFTDSDVNIGEEYCYYVTQVSHGVESDPSEVSCAVPLESNIIVNPFPQIDFSDVKAGMGSMPVQVEIINNSIFENIDIQSISIVGPGSQDFQINFIENSSDFPLLIASSIEIEVSFQPLSVGEKNAQLVIYSSSQVSSVQVNLSGRGFLSPPTNVRSVAFDSKIDVNWDRYNLVPQGSGDHIESPFMITEIPFLANGSTLSFTDDYDEACPFQGAGSPDVVYAFDSPGGNFDISLCESGYDTKVYIYNSMMDTVACNDDFCETSLGEPYRSLLEDIFLEEGRYFIIVDGYGNDQGEYQLELDFHSNRSYNLSSSSESYKLNEDPISYYEYNNRLFPFYSEQIDIIDEEDNNNPNQRDNYQINRYNIYRTTNPNVPDESFSLVSTVSSSDENNFSDLLVNNDTEYFYKITVTENTYGESDFSEITSSIPRQSYGLPYFSDFELNDGGFIIDGQNIFLWEHGNVGVVPGDAYSGTNVLGTNLDGMYQNNLSEFIYNIFDLTDSSFPVYLRFAMWLNAEQESDYLRVIIDHDNDGSWDILESFTGDSDDWEIVSILIPEEKRSSYSKIGFLFISDEQVNGFGAYIDDISIIASNPPEFSLDEINFPDVIEDQIYSYEVAFNDVDGGPPSNYIAEVIGPAAAWLNVSSILNVGGTSYIVNLVGTADDENLYHSNFSLIIKDENDLSTSSSFSLNIIPRNDVPSISEYIGSETFFEDTEFQLSIFDFSVQDPDNLFPGDFSASGLTIYDGDNYSVNGSSILPSQDFYGDIFVPVSVNDGVDESPIFILELFIQPVNDAPQVNATFLDSVIEDTFYETVIYFTDVDGTEDIEDFTIDISGSANNWLSIDTSYYFEDDDQYLIFISGLLDDQNLNDNILNLDLSDGIDNFSIIFTLNLISVNDIPIIEQYLGDSLIFEDTEFSLSIFDFNIQDPDNLFPGDFSASGLTIYDGDNYSVNGSSILSSQDFYGDLLVPVSVNDGVDESPIFILDLFVQPVNDAPEILNQIVAISVNEDEQFQILPTVLSVFDIDGDSIFDVYIDEGENYTVVDQNILLPSQDFNGILNIPTFVMDSSGGISNIFNIELDVIAVNDAPLVSDISITPAIPGINDDFILSYSFIDVDMDVELGTTIQWYKDGIEQELLQDQLVINASETLCEEEWYASITPSDGIINGENVQSQVVVICGNNTSPMWVDDEIFLTINEDEKNKIVSMEGRVIDAEQAISQLSFSVISISDTANIDAGFDGYDLVLNTKSDNFYSEEPLLLSIAVDDQQGYADTAFAYVDILPVNDAPVVSSFQGQNQILEDSVFQILISDLDIYDVDNLFPDDFSLEILAGDNYFIIENNFVKPDSNYFGSIVVPIIVNDGTESSDVFELTFTVTPVNDAPVIIAQLTMSTVEDSIYTITLADLIYEDVDNSGSDLSILLGQGEFFTIDTTTVIPDNNFVGSITVPTYLFDGQDSSESAFDLVIDVLGINDAPFLVTGVSDIVVDEDSDRRSFSLISNDGDTYFSDNDFEYGDLLSYSVENGSNNLLMVSVGEDSVHIDFMPDSNGVDTLYVTATDLSGQFVIDTIVVTVTPVNDAPVIVGALSEFEIEEDDSILISIDDFSIIDIENDNVTISILEGDNYINDGLMVIPAENYFGSLIVPVVANDGSASSEPFQIIISINGINDTPLNFDLLSPANGEIITVLNSDIIENEVIPVRWTQSDDVDGDLIFYAIEMNTESWSQTIISNLPDTSYNIPFGLIVSILDTLNVSELSIDWTVFSTDGVDTLYADQIFTLNIDAYDVLNVDELLIPESYALHQNYPNPFNPTTTLKYDLPEATTVSIKIFDVLGKEVATLINNMHQNPGFKSVRWNGLNKDGKLVVSGMYFFSIKTENFNQTRKMIMIK